MGAVAKRIIEVLTDIFDNTQPGNRRQLWAGCIFLAGMLVYFATISQLSEGTYGGADDLHHYRFARWAFRYPEFFVDHWGKPLFTTLCSPFAQLGYNGARLYNVLVAIATAAAAVYLARLRGMRNSLLLIFFVLFAPVFMSLIPSVMTEITGALCLTLALALYFGKKYSWSAAVISFVPLARTEGFLIIPFFFVMLLMRRQWKALPWLVAGLVLFSLAGMGHYKDFFWLITKIPYGSFSADIYGRGSFMFYLGNPAPIIGILLGLLFLVGIALLLVQLIQNRLSLSGKSVDEFVLILMPVIAIVGFHSLAWYLGTGALALYRFMAFVIPPAVFFSLKGYNYLEQLITFGNRSFRLVLKIIVVVAVIHSAFVMYRLPVPLSPTAKIIKESCNWLKEHDYIQNKIFYYDPNVFFFLDLDPHDAGRSRSEVFDVDNPGRDLQAGSILVWDAHFGPNEGRLPLERLIGNTDFNLLREFHPAEPFKVLGGYPYAVYIFQRL